jgi:hypothetical protein
VKRELIAVEGTRQLRESVGVGETGSKETRVDRISTSVDNCKEACGLERGAAISCEGNALKGGKNPRNGCGTKQGREAKAG